MKTPQSLILLVTFALTTGCASTRLPAIPDGFVQVKSGYIDAVKYEATASALTVRYEDGCVHRFSNIALCRYYEFMATPGKKGYFMAHFEQHPYEIVRKNLPTKKRQTRTVGMRYEPNGGSYEIYRSEPFLVD